MMIRSMPTAEDQAVLSTERQLLSAVFAHNERIDQVNGLQANYFNDVKHRAVFSAMQSINRRGKPIDAVTMELELSRQGTLEAIGGLGFLAELYHSDDGPLPDNISHWADAIESHGRERMLRGDLGELVSNRRLGPDELAARARRIAQAYIGEDAPAAAVVRPLRIADVIPEILAESALPMVSTGIPGFDRALDGGLTARGIHVIVAGSGKGKSSLAAQIAAFHSERSPAAYYTGEMTRAQLAARIVAQRTMHSWRDILRGRVLPVAMETALAGLELDLIRRCDDPIARITEAVDEMVARNRGIPLMVVDYVQLLADMGKDPRIGTMEAMRGLTSIAESRDVVLLVLSQGSRASARVMRERQSQSSEDYVDVAAETQQIERDATTMIVLTYHSAEGVSTHEVTAMVAKQRTLGRCKIGLKFHGPSGRWEDLGHELSPVTSQAERNRLLRIDTILKVVAENRAKLTKTELRKMAKGNPNDTGKIIDALVDDGKLMVITTPREEAGGQRKGRDLYDLPTPQNSPPNAREPGEDYD